MKKFIDLLIERFELTYEQAKKVYNIYTHEKILKIDCVSGGWKISHGVFMERDIIMNAVNYKYRVGEWNLDD